MGIATRLVKIFKADVHGVMDQFEDQGLLLKQYLRDMAEALNHKEGKVARMVNRRDQTRKEHDKYYRQYQALDHDLTVAVRKGKDDIARMLIRKTKPLTGLCDGLADRIASLDEELAQIKEQLSEQRLRYDQLKIQSNEYFHRAEFRARKDDRLDILPDQVQEELSEEEIELELIKRREAS